MFAMDSAVACDSQIFCPMYDIVVLWLVFNQPCSLACQRGKEFVIAENFFLFRSCEEYTTLINKRFIVADTWYLVCFLVDRGEFTVRVFFLC